MTDWREELIETMVRKMWRVEPDNNTLMLEDLARAALEVAEPVIREQCAKADHLRVPLSPIEVDKFNATREYIPLPGGWEIQTKGRGSSYRLCDKKSGERHIILSGDAAFIQDFVTRMAKEIHAAIREGGKDEN